MSEIPRTFVKQENINSDTGIILVNDADELHHLVNVVRIKVNSQIIILDNKGFEYRTKIIDITNKELRAQIADKKFILKYPRYSSTLIQSAIKISKLETIVQKATELGIDNIIIVQSDHSISELERSASRLVRLKKIILSACKQCKRVTIPVLKFENCIDDLLIKSIDKSETVLNFVFMEGDTVESLKKAVQKGNKNFTQLNAFIGPEGGWSIREKKLFSEYNLTEVSLGKNVLRSETSSVIALGVLFYEFNDE